MVYEGGIRVPMVARWTGTIPAGTVSAHASAFDDYMPTFAEMAGLERPAGIDGVSMLAALQGRASGQKPRDYLYWEFQGNRSRGWAPGRASATRRPARSSCTTWRRTSERPPRSPPPIPRSVSRLEGIMRAAHTDSPLFPLVKG